jgi:excinuclease UvrABC nuclease subunit
MTIGVYLLRKGTEVVYVGQSRDIENRLSQHRAIRRDFDSFEIIETPVEDLLRIEQEYILKYRPAQNGMTTRWGRSFLDRDGTEAKTSAERQARHREKVKAVGYRQFTFWLNPDDHRTAMRVVRWVQYQMAKNPNYEPYLKAD